ncbi:MAG: hypothetical protein DCF30_11715 [Hyphomicrobiales bacterium]|nr:MAG: hypothetical protein DCF30_11715 [Hyphomicrobiales bacterium]
MEREEIDVTTVAMAVIQGVTGSYMSTDDLSQAAILLKMPDPEEFCWRAYLKMMGEPFTETPLELRELIRRELVEFSKIVPGEKEVLQRLMKR